MTLPHWARWVLLAIIVVVQWIYYLRTRKKPSADTREMIEIAKRIGKLERHDPAAAQRLADAEFAAFFDRKEKRRASLRERARGDVDAARSLRVELLEELEMTRAALKPSRWPVKLPELPPAQRIEIQQDQHKLEAEIAALDRRIGGST